MINPFIVARQFFGARRVSLLSCAAVLIAVLGWASWISWHDASVGDVSPACIPLGANHQICAASDMARPSRRGAVPLEHADFDLRDSAIRLHAARNETVGFQIIVRTVEAGSASLSVKPTKLFALAPPAGNGGSAGREDIAAANLFNQQVFRAHYVQIDSGGYTWGPPTRVLPWPAAYPDALIPMDAPCGPDLDPGPGPVLLEQIELPVLAGRNQAVWIDTFIAPAVTPGQYSQQLELAIGQARLNLSVELVVHAASLPDKPNIDAVGELYAAYEAEGVGRDVNRPAWQAMAQCYQRLAHQHRTVFIERFPKGLAADQQRGYVQAFGPALSGELFTTARGYQGPGLATPVTVWRPPWPQRVDVHLEAPLSNRELARYQALAKQWQKMVTEQRWDQTRYFAYVFDEIDGPPKPGVEAATHSTYLAMAHQQMARVQQALDAGSPSLPIDLLWTSHSNPVQWLGKPGLDLTGTIRLWAPNAGAADPQFMGDRSASGNTTWFYHSGHPAVGAHSINASGIEMRTWGVIGARYGFKGQFMWAVNLGSETAPFAQPSYKPDDDRVGNGVLVYPGNQLPLLGLPSRPGPIPSMRLKAWRRGLQDAELFFLARQKDAVMANALIRELVPQALADGRGEPSWPAEPARWIEFRRALLAMASQ